MTFFKRKGKTKSLECHTGTVKAFEDPETGVPYYGGGTTRDLVIYANHLIVAMTSIDADNVVLHNFNAPKLLKYNNPVVELDWPDYGVPVLQKPFWLDLIETINEEWLAKRIKGVTCCCVGGHGRTGTALAILAGLTGASKFDPVLFIRKHYCSRVVESDSQIKYIEEMTGINVTAKANKTSYYMQGNLGFDLDDDIEKVPNSYGDDDDIVEGNLYDEYWDNDDKFDGDDYIGRSSIGDYTRRQHRGLYDV